MENKKNVKRIKFFMHNHFLHVIYVLAFVTSIYNASVYTRCCFLTLKLIESQHHYSITFTNVNLALFSRFLIDR